VEILQNQKENPLKTKTKTKTATKKSDEKIPPQFKESVWKLVEESK